MKLFSDKGFNFKQTKNGRGLFSWAMEFDKTGKILQLLTKHGYNPPLDFFHAMERTKVDSKAHSEAVDLIMSKEVPKTVMNIIATYGVHPTEAFENALWEDDLVTARELMRLAVVDPNYSSKGKGSPLLIAIEKNHWDIAEELVNRGANPDNYAGGESILMVALAKNDQKLFDFALSKTKVSPFASKKGSEPLEFLRTSLREEKTKAEFMAPLVHYIAARKITAQDTAYMRFRRMRMAIIDSGHILGLSGKISLLCPIDNSTINVNMEGDTQHDAAELLRLRTVGYLNKLKSGGTAAT